MAVIRANSEGLAVGAGGRDKIYGDSRDNNLFGFGGNDRLYGYGGDDYFFGHQGRDVMTGGAGFDVFHFTTRPSKNSVDVVTDYNKKYDTIALDKLFFKGIGKADGWMKSSAFWQGTKAHDSNDRIIYNSKNGIVYYDSDGSGSKEAVPFVKIGAGRKMAATDFWVVDY